MYCDEFLNKALTVAPCQNCVDRFVGCHAGCERYNLFKERRNAVNTEREERRDIQDYVYTAIKRMSHQPPKDKPK